jgi:Zn-dependent metalloprotease
MNQNLPLGKVLTLLCATAMSLTSSAQNTNEALAARQRVLADPKVASVNISEERNTPSLIALKENGSNYSKAQARQALTNYLNLRPGVDDLVQKREVRVNSAFEVMEYQQYYKGIKVEHSRYTALIKNGEVAFYNGAFYGVPSSLPIQARISKSEALGKAKGRVNAKKYAWETVEEKMKQEKNLGAKAALAIEWNEYQPEGELVIVKDFNKKELAEMRLAYKFNIYAFEPLSRDWVYIDAEDGKVLLVDKIIKHADNPGGSTSASVTTTVQTRYAGNREIKTKQISGNDPNNGLPLLSSNPLEVYVPGSTTFSLIDDSRGGGVETYDLNGVGGLPISLAPAYSQAKSFTDVNNNWTLAEHNRGGTAESENDDIAWDAHWGAGVVYDYWKSKQNRLSFDGNNAKIKSYIHSGAGYDNAFWNGSVMTYGDGSFPAPGGFKPLTSLDVCAHEIGHGVCSFTADLVYEKESGAMNEGYSDIWAACAEYFAIKQIDPSLAALYKPFYIGEQISANPARPLRRMDNPKAEGDPDTYGGVNWKNPDCSPSLANDQCGVHSNSGLLNKWFYLMTVGSGSGSGPDAVFAGTDDGVNDKGNTYSVTGLGFDVAERIAYLTELMLTSTAKFEEAREVSIQVAAAVSGNPCSSVVKTVTDSWYAVGVGSSFVQPCSITYGFVYQPGGFVSEGQSGAGCAAEFAVAVPFVMPANATATITVSGTANNSSDYRLSGTSFTNSTSNSKQDSLIIFVKNDAVIEGNETVVLNIALTNTGTSPVNKIYTLNIVEDDVTPVISNGSRQLLTETFTRGDGFAEPTGWREILEVPEEPNGVQAAKGKNQWGIFGNKLSITGKDEITGTQLPNGTYNNNSLSQTIVSSPLIDARGLNTMQLKFDYSVQGEVDPAGTDPSKFPAFDYMAIVYSFDGNTWYELAQPPFIRFASSTPTKKFIRQ